MSGLRKLGWGLVGGLTALVLMSLGATAAQIGPIRPSGGGGTTIPTSARVPFLASCPTGWTQDATLDGTMLLATTAGHGDVGQTGGANLVTPTGVSSIPSFTGNAVTSSAVTAGTPAGSVTQPALTMNSYTPAGTNGTVAFTPAGTNGTGTVTATGTVAWPVGVPTAANESAHTHAVTAAGTNGTGTVTATGTVAWPAGVPTFTGNAFSSVINHTHTITITDPGHNTIVQGGTTAATTGTHIMTSTATGGSARNSADGTVTTGVTASSANPGGGVASITPAGTNAWPAGVPTFSGSSATTSAQTFTGSGVTSGGGSAHTHTLSWPGGVPTFSGSSATTSAQTFTGSSGTVSAQTFSGAAATLTGTVSTPSFTGSALGTHQHSTTSTGSVSAPLFTGDQFDNRSAYTKVIWCRVTSSEPAPVATAWGQFLSFGLIIGLAVALFLRKP